MPDERPSDLQPPRSPEPRDDAEQPPFAERPRDTPPIDPFAHLAPPPAPAEAEPEEDAEMAFEDEYDLDAEPTRLVMIRTFATPVDADIARLTLDALEIPSVVTTDGSLTMPYMIIASGIRLYVPDWAVEDALEALAGEDDDEDEDE
ncbi:MAG TPA: hypothetical protein VFR81_16960 [Longimicrobium sp.]|nr:hypothetical protein [Longimicrobium sp.]